MPCSVRVRKGSNYTALPEQFIQTPAIPPSSAEPPRSGPSPHPSLPPPSLRWDAQGQGSGSQRRPAVGGRRRSRTLTSLFGTPGTTGFFATPTIEQPPTANRPQSSSGAASATVGRARSATVSTGVSGELRPQSWVAQSIMRGSVRGGAKVPRRGDARFLAAPRPGSPSQRETLIGSGTAQVDVRMSDADARGAVGRSLSFTSEVEGSQGDFIDDDVHHMDEVVEHLDVIDAHIATVSHLSNAANSILIPPLGLYNRKPIVTLPTLSPSDSVIDVEKGDDHDDELDRHVEHVLKKRDKLRRSLKGLWAFLKTPIGVITAIYGFLVAFWGAAIVVFLIKIINFHNSYRQKLWIEISSQVENGLFTLTGVGLIPWRAMDIYRIARIWQYKRLSRTLRKKAGLAPLIDENDLPDPMYDPNYIQVLTDKQQEELHDLQQKFMHSQTWYRPHATDTHRAFPINTALLICSLIGGNSFFQCILCGTMWGLNRYNRPAWSTGILIPASFLCGIFAAVFVWRGGQKTKKTREVEGRLREALERRGLLRKDASQNTEEELGSPTKEEGTLTSAFGSPLDCAPVEELPSPSEPVTITTFGGHAGHLP